MLQLLLLIPLIGSFILLLIPEGDKVNNLKIKNIGLLFSIINFIVSIFIWSQFDSSASAGYQFVCEITAPVGLLVPSCSVEDLATTASAIAAGTATAVRLPDGTEN